MAISKTRPVLLAGLALLVAACGTATSGQLASTRTAPAMTVTPDTGLTSASPSPAAGLAHSSLLGTSWVSPTKGWALAAQPCASGTCARIARTTDSGLHWQVLPAPAATVPATVQGSAGCPAAACVSQISFAGPATGYLYGPGLLMTTDGGLTWHAQPGPRTETLTVTGGRAYRVTYAHGGCPGPCQPSLQEAPAGSASWRTLIGQLAEPARSGSAQIVASGPDLLVAMYGSLAAPVPAQAVVYRSADAGGTWRQVPDPCRGLGPGGPNQEEDLTALAAAPGGFFAGICAPHGPTGTFVITSADAGGTWRPTAVRPPGQWPGIVAAASPDTIAVASGAMNGNGTYTAQLLLTTDGGGHWFTAATDTQDLTTGTAPAWLGFESPLAGQWLADPHGIWITTDGGRHWTKTAFR